VKPSLQGIRDLQNTRKPGRCGSEVFRHLAWTDRQQTIRLEQKRKSNRGLTRIFMAQNSRKKPVAIGPFHRGPEKRFRCGAPSAFKILAGFGSNIMLIMRIDSWTNLRVSSPCVILHKSMV
jgi:hypothetical protein